MLKTDGASRLGPQLPLGLCLTSGARLNTFYPGANAAALAALERSINGKGAFMLYLWGGRGSGKSHLLQAVCREAADRDLRPAYLPLAERAVLDPGMVEGWGALHCICVDDVDCIAQMTAWEQALFKLCNAVKDRGGLMIVAAPAPPMELGLRLADLASRFAWGPVFRLASLDDDGRIAALKLKASRRGLTLPDETAQYLMRRLNRDMNTLTATLDQLDRASLAAQRRLTIPFVKAVLGV